mgnify:CR=1 FL=1
MVGQEDTSSLMEKKKKSGRVTLDNHPSLIRIGRRRKVSVDGVERKSPRHQPKDEVRKSI